MAKWHDNNNDIIKKKRGGQVGHAFKTICVCGLIVIIRKTSMNDMLGSLKIAAE